MLLPFDIDWSIPEAHKAVYYPAVVYAKLKAALEKVQTSLLICQSAATADVGFVAWQTRNALELRVWTAYCIASEANAREFGEDGLRDLIDMNRKEPNLRPDLRVELDKAGASLDATKPVHKFKGVRDAAKESGLETLYEDNYKMLSKFAHPTALSVMTPIGDDPTCGTCGYFLAFGTAMTAASLAALESSSLKVAHDRYFIEQTA